ncbi:MAG: T9SS type A sorting domain-containing protein [Chloroflexota bacterium]
MKTRLRLFWVMLSAALLLFGSESFAQKGKCVREGHGCKTNCGKNFVDANNDGKCDNFVDADGDGKCDLKCGQKSCDKSELKGRCCGKNFVDANNDGKCDNFVDANGDGKCDLGCGKKGSCKMVGMGKGMRNCPEFVDANNDGKCDNFVDANGDGKCDSGPCGKGKQCRKTQPSGGAAEKVTFELGNPFPMPSGKEINFSVTTTGIAQATIELYDSNGKLVREIFAGELKKGENILTASSQDLQVGTYILKASVAGKTISKNLVISK